MTDRKRLLQALLRNNFAAFAMRVFQTLEPGTTFQPNWHHEAMAYQLEQVRLGRSRRLVINLPPRTAKSIYVSVAFCAYLHGLDPTKKIACLSYSGELASKLARDYRTILQADWYRELFPATRISPEKNTEAEIVLTARGYRLAWSMSGTITGRGADLIIVDDPLKAEDAFSDAVRTSVNERFDGTILSRQDNKKSSAIIIVMQRLHLEDLSGHVLEKGGWTHLSLPAIAVEEQTIKLSEDRGKVRLSGEALHPEREPRALLEDMRREAGELRFSAQYQQDPVPAEGNIIKWSWFETYDLPSDMGRIVQSWDTAEEIGASNAYSVCITFRQRGRRHEVLHVLRERLHYPDLRRKLVEHAKTWGCRLALVEHASLGKSLFYDLREQHDAPAIIPIHPEGDKLTRMAACSALIEARMVALPKQADWLDGFKSELLQFPNGAHADQTDALSQYLNWSKTNFFCNEIEKTWSEPLVQVFVGGVPIHADEY